MSVEVDTLVEFHNILQQEPFASGLVTRKRDCVLEGVYRRKIKHYPKGSYMIL